MLPKNANLYKDNINKIQFYTLYAPTTLANIQNLEKKQKLPLLIFHMLNLQSVWTLEYAAMLWDFSSHPQHKVTSQSSIQSQACCYWFSTHWAWGNCGTAILASLQENKGG